MVERIKLQSYYKDQNQFLNFVPTEGKSVDLVENCNGQKFIIFKFIDKDGTHLRIFKFEIDTGMIGA